MRALHLALCCLAAFPLLLANFSLTMAQWLYVLADKAQPRAIHGNCWSYALVMAWKHGGYAAMRPVRGAWLLVWGRLYHCAWMPEQPDSVLQTEPYNRYTGLALLWRWVYFRFWIRRRDDEKPGPWRE